MDPVNINLDMKHVLGRTWVIEGSGLMGLYRLDGGKCILLDSGELFEREALAELLDRSGLTPIGVISSHIHVDHAINNGWLKERYGTLVAVPAGEADFTRRAESVKAYFYSAPPGVLKETFRNMEGPVDVTIPAHDGTFTFCGVAFQILHTPGHSLDHLAIITPDQVCYAGDAVVSGEVLQAKLPYHLCLELALESGERLRSTDCRSYIVTHRGVHTDINAVVDDAADLIRRRASEILSLITRPMHFTEIWQAVNEHFSLLSSRPVRAALMERNLRSFLDYLMDVGQLQWSADRGLLYYAPVEGGNES